MKRAHVEILDEDDLSDLVEQEPSDKNDEVSPPQIVDVQRVPRINVVLRGGSVSNWETTINTNENNSRSRKSTASSHAAAPKVRRTGECARKK